MRLFSFVLRSRLAAATLGAFAAVAVGSVAWASTADTGGVIHGCYKTVSGALRVINTDTGGTCLRSETSLDWNQTGPTGPAGTPGLDSGIPPDASAVGGPTVLPPAPADPRAGTHYQLSMSVPRANFAYLFYADMQAVASGGSGEFHCELLTDFSPGPHTFVNSGPIPDGIATKVQSVPGQTYAVTQTVTLDCFNASQVPITLSQIRFMAVLI